VLDIPVTQVGLKSARIVSFVRESVAAGVSQHVWMRFESQLCLSTGTLDHPCEPCGGEWRATL
jgi:hypothetical protein